MKERITTLAKTKERASLTKLKLNLPSKPANAFLKTSKYFGQEIEVDYDTDLSSIFVFSNFNVECEAMSDKTTLNRYAETSGTAWKLTIKDKFNHEKVVYTLAGGNVKDNARKYSYRLVDRQGSIRVLDVRYIYGMLKFIDIVQAECENNKMFFEEGFSDISIWGNSYKKDNILEDLVDLSSLNAHFSLHGQLFKLVFDVIYMLKLIDSNKELSNKYDKDSQKECARAFETKKNIPEKIQKIMDTSKFLKEFSYLELDEDVDIKKFKVVESEWSKVYKCLNIQDKNWIVPQLRFRKLGKHRALGIYFPSLSCICVIINVECFYC